MEETRGGIAIAATKPQLLPGSFLLVAGDALHYQLPMSANHIARHLGMHVERLDVVGFKGAYGGTPTTPLRRIYRGVRNILSDRVRVSNNGTTRSITIRKFHMPKMLDIAIQSMWVYLNLRPFLAPYYEVGLIYGPEHLLLMSILRLEKRVGRLVYIDVDNLASYYSYPWSGMIALLEKASVRRVDGVVSVSRLLASLRKEQGARLVRLVPNGVDFSLFHEAFLNKKPHPPTLIYVGTLDMRWGIDLAIRALPLIREKISGVRLLVVGKGPDRQKLEDLAGSLGMTGIVQFAGLVPQRELPGMMSGADLGIATSRADVFRLYASPLKICEYMAAGLPVICSGGGDAERIIEETGAGINVSFTQEAFAHAAVSMLSSAEKMADAAESGIAYALSRSWEMQVARLAGFLAEMTGKRDDERDLLT